MTICNKNNIISVSQDKCIANLLSSKNATCSHANGQHIPQIEEIHPGNLLLNNFHGKIEINGTIQTLKGTFIIKFDNTTVTINKQKFTSDTLPNTHILPPFLQTTSEDTDIEEILSLEWMKELHINNTRRIDIINTEKTIHQWVSYSIMAAIILVAIFISVTRRKRKEVITMIQQPTSNHLSSEIGPQEWKNSIFSIPYF